MSRDAFGRIARSGSSIGAFAWLFYPAIRIERNTEVARAAVDPSIATSIEIRDPDS